MKKRFLQHFTDGAGGTGGQGGTAGSGSGSGGTAGAAAGGQGSAGYTYEQLEEVAASRAERASRAALADFFRKQGMSEEEITTAINDFGSTLQSFGYPIFFVVLVIGAICLMVGQQGRAIGKVIMLSGAIGVAIVSFAPTIVTSLQSILSATTGGGTPT